MAVSRKWYRAFQAQSAVASTKTSGGDLDYSNWILTFVTTRTNQDKGGDVELSVLGVDIKWDNKNDSSQQIASRLRFSVQFSIPEAEMKKDSHGKR